MKIFVPAGWLRGIFSTICLLAFTSGLRATTVIPPDFDQLVNESDYIIRAVVTSVTSDYRTNVRGKVIMTKVALDVREVIAGTPPTPAVLEIMGGRIGDEEMRVQGAPRFTVGEEDVLFVRDNGRTIVPLVAMMHGRYPVMKEAATGRRYMARDNKTPLSDTAEVALPAAEGALPAAVRAAKGAAQAMTPDEFSKRIKAAVNPRYVRTKP